MAAVVGIISGCGPNIDVHCRNQPNKSKLALYNPLLSCNSYLKQLYISDKTERFSYKGGCGMHGHAFIKPFKRRAGLGYR